MDGVPILVGVAFRPQLSSWIDDPRAPLDCLELTGEEFYKGGRGRLSLLSGRFSLVLRTVRLSLGSPGSIDELELAWFASLVREARPAWICEHLGFRHSGELDFGSVVPFHRDERSLRAMTERVLRVRDACESQILIGNIASSLGNRGGMPEPQFLNRLCSTSGCRVALDLTALFTNSRNFSFDPCAWIEQLEAQHVTQINLGGARQVAGFWESTRDCPVQREIWDLLSFAIQKCEVRAVILDRAARFPPVDQLTGDLQHIRSICDGGA